MLARCPRVGQKRIMRRGREGLRRGREGGGQLDVSEEKHQPRNNHSNRTNTRYSSLEEHKHERTSACNRSLVMLIISTTYPTASNTCCRTPLPSAFTDSYLSFHSLLIRRLSSTTSCNLFTVTSSSCCFQYKVID